MKSSAKNLMINEFHNQLVKYAIVWKKKKHTFWSDSYIEALEITQIWNKYHKANGLFMLEKQTELVNRFKNYEEVRVYNIV